MRRFLMFLFLVLVIAGIGFYFWMKTGKGQTTVLNFITPSSSYTLEKNFGFGPHPRDRIDFYTSKDSDDSKPLIVFIHGGGWDSGDKSMYKFVAEGLTTRGYDVAVPNYRLYPEVKNPEFLKDNARAIAAIHKRYPTRYLVLIGHSAGAYNALGMVFKPQYLEEEGILSCYTIRGVVSLAAPTGALPAESEPTITIFPERFQGDDSYLKHLEQPLPPMLLLNGDQDTSVNYRNAVELGKAMEGRGIATVEVVEGADHVMPVSQFSTRGFLEGPIKETVINYIEGLPEDEGGGFCK